jgi:hypothetical protein
MDGGRREAHAGFVAHFTDAIYEPDAPDNDEVALFGTDEGADELREWSKRPDELLAHPTVRYMLGEDAEAIVASARSAEQPDIDDALIGAGFTLIRVAGRIDREGRTWVREALRGGPGVARLAGSWSFTDQRRAA